jgi:hypothetical protein
MTLDDVYRIARLFPMAEVQEDLTGQVIIYTGMMYDAPLGYNGFGPQNIPPNRREDTELREMTHEDIT